MAQRSQYWALQPDDLRTAAIDEAIKQFGLRLECRHDRHDVAVKIEKIWNALELPRFIERLSSTALPDRECFWLVERNTSPPQYVSLSSAGWHPDVWVARRFNTEREAHDYWRLMGETDRPQFKVVEHMFINKNPT